MGTLFTDIRYKPDQNADGLSQQAWNTVDEDVAHLEKGGDVRITPDSIQKRTTTSDYTELSLLMYYYFYER